MLTPTVCPTTIREEEPQGKSKRCFQVGSQQGGDMVVSQGVEVAICLTSSFSYGLVPVSNNF